MTAVADPQEETPPKASKLPLLLGVVLALAGGGGGFYAVSSGLLFGSESDSKDAGSYAKDDAGGADTQDGAYNEVGKTDITFVPLDPLIISLPSNEGTRFLRFTAQLEVAPDKTDQVNAIMPRIVDVLNGYLRAVSLDELADPTVLVRLRAQMLRRVQVVTGADQVTDLLIMEFVLN